MGLFKLTKQDKDYQALQDMLSPKEDQGEETTTTGILSKPDTKKEEDEESTFLSFFGNVFDRSKSQAEEISRMMQEEAERSALEVRLSRQTAGITRSLPTEIANKRYNESALSGPMKLAPRALEEPVPVDVEELETPKESMDNERQSAINRMLDSIFTSDSDTTVVTDEADGGAAPSDGKGLMSPLAPSESLRPRARPTELEDPTQALLDRIALGEGADPSKLSTQEKHGIGTTVYDMVYNYGDTLAPSKPVSEMTMKELYDFQTKLINATKGTVPGTKLGTSAVGKYQVIRKSLFGTGTAEKPMKNSWADKLNLKLDTVYTPEVQEKIARLALQEAGYNSFIKGTKTEEAFHDRIANIWASVARSSGKDTYGQGIHTIKADLDPMYALLKDQR